MKKFALVPEAAKMVASFDNNISPRVSDAMSRVDRAEFVPKNIHYLAYSNQALEIGRGQTISQPALVCLMTDLLDLTGKEKVLEVGTGSGYQTAILAQLAKKVVSVEFDRELAAAAELRLLKLGIENVTIVVGDGSEGFPAEAPYNRILVTAAAPNLIQTLVDQLRPGGSIVIPVGGRKEQQLLKVTKNDELKITKWGSVYFVPLLGKYGWKS